MLSYGEFPFALFLTQPIQSQTTPVIIHSATVNPNARLSLLSVTLAMIVSIAFALIIRRYLLRGMLSGALQQGASGSTRPASLVGYKHHAGTMNPFTPVARGGGGL